MLPLWRGSQRNLSPTTFIMLQYLLGFFCLLSQFLSLHPPPPTHTIPPSHIFSFFLKFVVGPPLPNYSHALLVFFFFFFVTPAVSLLLIHLFTYLSKQTLYFFMKNLVINLFYFRDNFLSININLLVLLKILEKRIRICNISFSLLSATLNYILNC